LLASPGTLASRYFLSSDPGVKTLGACESGAVSGIIIAVAALLLLFLLLTRRREPAGIPYVLFYNDAFIYSIVRR
jgi:uncharacterized protein (TIGR03382 family)